MGEIEVELESVGGEAGEYPVDLGDVVETEYWQAVFGYLEEDLQELLSHTAVGNYQLTPVDLVHHELLHVLLHLQIIHHTVLVFRVEYSLRYQDVLFQILLSHFELLLKYYHVLLCLYPQFTTILILKYVVLFSEL